MEKRQKTNIKGMVFLLILLILVGVYIIWYSLQDNMTVNITVYDGVKPLPNAVVSIMNKKAYTLEDGTAIIRLRAKVGDKLIVSASHQNLSQRDTVIIDKSRFLASYAMCDIVLIQN